MNALLLVDSKFMVSERFGVGDVPKEPVVTIVDTKLEVQEGDKGKEKWGILYFAEPWAKPLKVNRTHQKALILMFGEETQAWNGKRIGLYAMRGTFFGKQSTAVRIKGSPDIKAPLSFTVKKFGGGKDTYDLKPMGATAKESGPILTVNFGKAQGWKDKPIADFDSATLDQILKEGTAMCEATPGEKWVAGVQACLVAVRAALEAKVGEPT